MADTGHEMLGLMQEHEAIRAYMKFLANSLGGLSEPTVSVRERLWSYRWGLYDFREAIKYHIELDDRIFGTILGGPVEDTLWEHGQIERQLDDLVRLAETAAKEAREGELNRHAAVIAGTFDKVCKLILEHIGKEDRLLGQVREDYWPDEENSRG